MSKKVWCSAEIPIGFTNLGNINVLLLQYEHSLESESDSSTLFVKEMLVSYMTGLFTSLQFPYAQFATKARSDVLIFKLFGRQFFDWSR